MTVCKLCGLNISEKLFESHSKGCLRKQFSRVAQKDNKLQSLFCQVCKADLSIISEAERHAHVNTCLDTNIASTCKNEEEVESCENKDTCSVCRKVLTDLPAIERVQHMNKCADQMADEKVWEIKKTEALDLAKKVILDCPVCGQEFKTKKGRESHLKRCATKHQVSSDVLQERITQQEEEYKKNLEAGYIPGDLLVGDPGKIGDTGRKASRKKRTVKKKSGVQDMPGRDEQQNHIGNHLCAMHGVDRKFEEDVQVALALSVSMTTQQSLAHKSEVAKEHSTPLKTHNTSCTLNGTKVDNDAFSLLMTQRKDAAGTKGKGRRKAKVCLEKLPLLVQSKQEVNSKLVDRVSGVILTQTKKETCATPKFSFSKVGKKYGLHGAREMGMVSCWNKTVMHDSFIMSRRDQVFYVTKLMPPITKCNVTAGSKVKNLASIPGWNSFKEPQVSHNKRHSVVSMPGCNETLDGVACTQTAVLLAELAQEHSTTVIQSPDTSLLNKTAFTEEPSGFLSAHKESDNLLPVLKDYASMVSNELFSDLTLHVAGQRIPAHKFVMATRCPTLLKLMKNDELDVGNFEKESVLVMLRFLYTGCVEVPKEVALDVRGLAYVFNIEELIPACQQVIDDCFLEPVPEETQSSNLNPDVTLQNMLKDAWGSSDDDDSSTDSDSESVKSECKTEETAEQNTDDKELESLYTYMATQRNRVHSHETKDNIINISENQQSDEDCFEVEQNQGGFVGSVINKTLNATISQGSVDRLKHLSDSEVLERIQSGSEVMFIHELSQVLTDGADSINSESDGSSSSSVLPSSSDSDIDCQKAESGLVMGGCTKSTVQSSSSDSDMDCQRAESGLLIGGCTKFTVQPTSSDSDMENISGYKTESELENELRTKFSRNEAKSSFQSNNQELGQHTSVPEVLSDNVDILECDNKMYPTPSGGYNSRSSSSVCFNEHVHKESSSHHLQCRDTLNHGNNSLTADKLEVNLIESDCSSVISDKNFSPKPQITFFDKNKEEKLVANSYNNLSRQREDSDSPTLFYNSQPQGSNVSVLDGSCTDLFDSFGEKSSFLQQHTGQSVGSDGKDQKEESDCSDVDHLNTNIDVSVASSPSPVFYTQKEPSESNSDNDDSSDLRKSKHCSSNNRCIDRNSESTAVIVDLIQEEGLNLRKRKRGESSVDKGDVNSRVKHQKRDDDSVITPRERITGIVNVSEEETCPEMHEGLTGKHSKCFRSLSRPQVLKDYVNYGINDAKEAAKCSKESQGLSDDQSLSAGFKLNEKSCDEEELIDLTTGSGDELLGKNMGADVWEGFEDDGVLLDCFGDMQPHPQTSQTSQNPSHSKHLPQSSSDIPSSPEIQSSVHTQSMGNQRVQHSGLYLQTLSGTTDVAMSDHVEDSICGVSSYGALEEVDEDVEMIDPPTDVSTNVSSLLDISDECVPEKKVTKKRKEKSKFKTPTSFCGGKTSNKKSISEWVPPSPYTPQPQYDTMATPQLQKERKNYGIRDMPKKKIINVLKHIYKETHDYETDPEFDQDAIQKVRAVDLQEEPDTSVGKVKEKAKERKTKPKKKTVSVKNARPTAECVKEDLNSKEGREKKSGQTRRVAAHNISASSASDSGESTSRSAVAEESILEADEAESKLSKRDVQYKQKQLWDLIISNNDLHLHILQYEPIEFEDFQKLIKDAKLNIGSNIVKDFLDDKSIPFSLRNQNKASYGRKGKKKQKS